MQRIPEFQKAFIQFAQSMLDAFHPPVRKVIDLTSVASGLGMFGHVCLRTLLGKAAPLPGEGADAPSPEEQEVLRETGGLFSGLAELLQAKATEGEIDAEWDGVEEAYRALVSRSEQMGPVGEHFTNFLREWPRRPFEPAPSIDIVAPIWSVSLKDPDQNFELIGHVGVHADAAVRHLLVAFFAKERWDVRDLNVVFLRDLTLELAHRAQAAGGAAALDLARLTAYAMNVVVEVYKFAKFDRDDAESAPKESALHLAGAAVSMFRESGLLLYEALHYADAERTLEKHFGYIDRYAVECGRAFHEIRPEIQPALKVAVEHAARSENPVDDPDLAVDCYGQYIRAVTGTPIAHDPDKLEVSREHLMLLHYFVRASVEALAAADDSALPSLLTETPPQ